METVPRIPAHWIGPDMGKRWLGRHGRSGRDRSPRPRRCRQRCRATFGEFYLVASPDGDSTVALPISSAMVCRVTSSVMPRLSRSAAIPLVSGFLHEPVRDAAIRARHAGRRLRSRAPRASHGRKSREADAAFASPLEKKKRLLIGACITTSAPSTGLIPIWRNQRLHLRRLLLRALQAGVTGWRWPVSSGARKRPARPPRRSAGRAGPPSAACARSTWMPAYSGPACNQQRAAIFHIFGDVVVIEDRQHVAVLVAVEDDQVESLMRSTKNSRVGKAISESSWMGVPSCFSGGRRMVEMHEVDGRVRAQQIAPGPLAGMGLARTSRRASFFRGYRSTSAMVRLLMSVISSGWLSYGKLDDVCVRHWAG